MTGGGPPRFSIVLPTVDRSAAITATIDGVRAQTEADWELIVVSDASRDDTDAVVRGYDDPRIRLIRRRERAGHPGPPRQQGLALARGTLVAYVDHDDRWEPEHLAQLTRLLEHREVDVAATGAIPVDARGRPVGAPTGVLDATWSPELQVLGPIFEPSRVGHRRGVVEAAGGWDAGPAGLEDWSLWLRLADAGRRFATSVRPTVRTLDDPATRRHKMAADHELSLGRTASVDEARRALDLLSLAPLRVRLRELHVACAARWYRELAAAGALVLPDGADVEATDLEALLALAVPEDTLGSLLDVREDDGGAVVFRPLPCATAQHARRVEALTRDRFADKLTFAQRVLRAATSSPAPA